MLRRTILGRNKLIIVESPNKVAKITSILNQKGPSGISDWSFGKPNLKSVAQQGEESVLVLPTIGHFLELRTMRFSVLPLPAAPPSAEPTAPPSTEQQDADTAKGGKRTKGKGRTNAPKAEEPLVDMSIFSSTAPLRHVSLEWTPSVGKDTSSVLVGAVEANKDKLTEIILASDPDREGELIASHALQTIQERLPKLKIPFSRAYIHSITEDGVRKAMEERQLQFVDQGLATAAETRHAMDRIFGFLGSSLVRHLNSNFRSIGRVQTPALIAVKEREERIDAYMKAHRASFSIQANCSFLDASGSKVDRTVTLNEVSPGKEADAVKAIPPLAEADLDNPAAVEAHGSKVKAAYLNALGLQSIRDIASKGKPVLSNQSTAPPLPFSMASLISKANKTMRLSSEEVAKCLQDLFQLGLITYPRTDSHRIDPTVVPSIKALIESTYGKDFLRSDETAAKGKGKGGEKKKGGKKKPVVAQEGNVEDAHEAIRPTDITRTAESIGASVSEMSLKLYDLVRSTTLAAFMTPLEQERVATTVSFKTASGAVLSFKLEAKRVTHSGFHAAFGKNIVAESVDAADDGVSEVPTDGLFEAVSSLPKRIAKAAITVSNAQVTKSKPAPPQQLSEGTLIDYLKERGVGRPSTYPSIMKTLLSRGYVEVNAKGKLETTQVGRDLATATQRVFPALVDVGFTASFEAKLDRIARAVTEESAVGADVVLSAFVVELLRLVKTSAENRRGHILERSITARIRHANPSWSTEQVQAAVEKSVAEAKGAMTDIFAATARVGDFSELQRMLENFLKREFPN